MKLLKVSIWSLIVISTDLIVGIINQKVYASFTGHAGLVLAGNFSNFVNILLLLGSGGILGGITKVIAERGTHNNWDLILPLLFIISAIVSLVTLFFWDTIYPQIIPPDLVVQQHYAKGFLIFLPLVVITNAFLHKLLGEQKITVYSLLRLALQALNLSLTIYLVYKLLLNGIILSAYLPATLLFFLVLMLFWKDFVPVFNIKTLIQKIRSKASYMLSLYRHLAMFSFATIISLLLLYTSQLYIRNYLTIQLSIEEASYWQILTTLSRIWIAFFSFIITSYIFPQLASMKDKNIVKQKVANSALFLTASMIITGIVIFALRNHIIKFIYGNDFLQATQFFHYQLLGDLFKLIAILLSYFLLSKSLIKAYIIAELIYYGTWLGVTFSTVEHYGLHAVFFAQIVASLIYLATLYIIFRVWIKSHLS